MTRYADWDAAIERRDPIKFKFLGATWKVEPLDFRDLASMFRIETYAGLTDEEATQKQVEFIGEHVTDKAAWLKATAEAKIAPSTLMGGLAWLLQKDVGMPLEIVDGDDPLDALPVLSPSAGRNGLSSVGGSRKSASKTR